MHHDVRCLRQDFFRVVGNFHSPRRIARSHYFAQVAPDFRGIVVNCSADFNRRFFPQQLGNRGANRPNPILNRAYLLFHLNLRLRNREVPTLRLDAHQRIFARGETYKIKDSACSGNQFTCVRSDSGRGGGTEIAGRFRGWRVTALRIHNVSGTGICRIQSTQ